MLTQINAAAALGGLFLCIVPPFDAQSLVSEAVLCACLACNVLMDHHRTQWISVSQH